MASVYVPFGFQACLLTSFQEAHQNKLSIGLLCPLSHQLTGASPVFYFLPSFLFSVFFTHQSAVLPLLYAAPLHLLGTNALIFLFYLWERQHSRMKGPISSVDQRCCPGASRQHHHCHSYVLFCTMSYLLIYSTPSPLRCPRLPLTSYLAH